MARTDKSRAPALAYLRTSSAVNVGTDKDSEKPWTVETEDGEPAFAGDRGQASRRERARTLLKFLLDRGRREALTRASYS